MLQHFGIFSLEINTFFCWAIIQQPMANFPIVAQWLALKPHSKKVVCWIPGLGPFWVEFACFPCVCWVHSRWPWGQEQAGMDNEWM